MRNHGGYATLRQLNEIIDFSSRKTKTPEASVRRIVQDSKHIFKIQPGLWALEESRDAILKMFVGDLFASSNKFAYLRIQEPETTTNGGSDGQRDL